MGLMDKVRAQATQLAQQAQGAAQEGKARLDQAQAGRRGDMLLRQLGALVFAERTGRGTADSQARIDQLISEISAHESQNGLNLSDPPQQGFGQSLLGQFGQPSPSQPPAGQTAPGQSGFGQPAYGQPPAPGQEAPGPQPGFPADPQAAPEQTAQPPAGPGAMPTVDTTTNFFPAPDDDPGGPAQS
jgi:hypothetical protein